MASPSLWGGYPLFADETCAFLAVDFDKAEWCKDAHAFLETCRRMGLPAALERSRSGQGGHVWLFFEQAIPAALARRLGSTLLTETMEYRPDVGLDSYDRLFPNQDFLPQGGFGNLIALPLQKLPRDRGNSVFLDDSLEPWVDQWTFLASLRRIGRTQIEGLVQEAERRGRVLGVRLPPAEEHDIAPWTAAPSRRGRDCPITGELPQVLELVLGNQIYIAKEGLPPVLRNRLLRLAAFQNPEFYKAQTMRLAVELDGPQHLADPIAYRRDRSKDRLLQQNGYFVLRFLTEDVGKELDLVLDSILRTLAGRVSRTSSTLSPKTGVLLWRTSVIGMQDGQVTQGDPA